MQSFVRIASLGLAGLLALTIIGTAAPAGMEIGFREGAPTDRFTIRNASSCAIEDAVLTIDLAPSRGGLVFDVTDAGAGVGVSQPLTVVEGRTALAATPRVGDGDRSVKLRIARLERGETIAFEADLDDTVGAREITVATSELSGAVVTLQVGADRLAATFADAAGTAVTVPGCDV